MKKIVFVVLLLVMSAADYAGTDKTLVAWFTLNDLNVDAGSVLTIQSGEQFDGIVFGELKPGVWVAGSENWNRTSKEYRGISTEKEEALGQMIQMAIVYEGNEIRIFRNGKLYTSYNADNIDLLSSGKNFIVFGLRHMGGDGSISGEIEDARIYEEALTLEEIIHLEPNTASELKPYAWWDFEGDEIKEKTGKYQFHNLGEWENVELENGKLVLSEHGFVVAVREYEPEIPQFPDDLPDEWPTYHLVHPGPGKADPGDPNPAFDYKGRYHLHYIYNDYFGFSYAHVSSEDMVHWKWHPTVLVPPKTGHGMFSGTGFYTREDQPVMIYHGAGSGRNYLTYATDSLLDLWTKPYPVLPEDENGSFVDEIEYWDPDCWIYKDTYYALSGGRDPALMKSKNLKDWKYLGKLLHEDYPDNLGVSRDEDISCANMFKIGNRWMLLCISHHLRCRYFLGDFKDEKYLPDYHALMNWVTTDWEEGPEELVYFAPE